MKLRDSTILISATGMYVGTLIVANVTAGKLFDLAGTTVSAGAFAYIVCLATSDVIVDIYGTSVGYRLVRIAAVANLVVLLFEQIALRLPITQMQAALQPHFAAVFDATAAVIVASMIGFPITDVVETWLWKRVKTLTRGKHLWLRNLCVKVPGQLLDATVFFSLAFFVLPKLFYGEPAVASSGFVQVLKGAWLYGLWKGCMGVLNYPVIRFVIPWIRAHRIADIPHLSSAIEEEAWTGRW